MSNGHKPSVVVIGGGTGTYTLLSGLKNYPVEITALLTMVDDGGSNRVLRDEFGLLPTSGVRQAIVALSQRQSLLRQLFAYRFHQGQGISGMTFGNLFLAAVSDIVGSQKAAIQATCELLSVKGSILPISWDSVRLVAEYEDGSRVVGEHLIDEPQHNGELRITNLLTDPVATISDEAREAILHADMLVLGPGDFYTNTIANLVVGGVKEAIMSSKAKLVFVTNLMTKYGEAYNYKASDYIQDLGRYLPLSRLNYVLVNSDYDFPAEAVALYSQEKSIPVADDLGETTTYEVRREPLLNHAMIKPEAGDTLKRSVIRHDSERLAGVLVSLAIQV